jgi:hypothetical protein
MACSKCKKKSALQQESKKEFNTVDTLAFWGVITWALLGLYGLYTLVINIIHIFK